MTSGQFLLALNRLGVTQVEFARCLKINERTVRDWTGGRSRVPHPVAALVNLMIKTNTKPEELKP